MLKEADIRNQSVIVNGASGIVLKPLTEEYLYIFTAYHAIKDKTAAGIKVTFHELSPSKHSIINIKEIVHNEGMDVAILQIENNLEGIKFIPVLDCYQECQSAIHIGFPTNRRVRTDVDKYQSLSIKKISIKDMDGFVGYEYDKIVSKKELEGMSGGGIFDEVLSLIGIHKKLANYDDDEMLGMANFIAIDHFIKLIESKQWSPVLDFNPENFITVTKDLFNFDNNKGLRNDLRNLLYSINSIKREIEKMSPFVIFKILSDAGKLKKGTTFLSFRKSKWGEFAEFLTGMHVLLEVELKNETILQIFDNFYFYYSPKDFDIFDARDNIDINAIRSFKEGAKIVVAGISSNKYDYDVCPPIDEVPRINNAIPTKEFDVSKTGKYYLDYVTIVNNCIFKDAMADKGTDIAAHKQNALEFYKELLLRKINKNAAY